MMENKTVASSIIKQTPLNCFDIISRATDLYARRDEFAYFYGAKGQVLTPALIKSLMLSETGYFSRYTKEELEKIYYYSVGKIGIDCSGFINLLTGQTNWSTGYWDEALCKTDPISGTWGRCFQCRPYAALGQLCQSGACKAADRSAASAW